MEQTMYEMTASLPVTVEYRKAAGGRTKAEIKLPNGEERHVSIFKNESLYTEVKDDIITFVISNNESEEPGWVSKLLKLVAYKRPTLCPPGFYEV